MAASVILIKPLSSEHRVDYPCVCIKGRCMKSKFVPSRKSFFGKVSYGSLDTTRCHVFFRGIDVLFNRIL